MDTNSIQTAPKVAQCVPKTTPGGSQSAPKWSQNEPKLPIEPTWNRHGPTRGRHEADKDKQNHSQKCVFLVYGPVWGGQWHHPTRNYTHYTCHSTPTCPKLPQSNPKVDPKSPPYAKSDPKMDPKSPCKPKFKVKCKCSASASTNAISMRMQLQMRLKMQVQTDNRCQSDPKVDPGVALAWTLQLWLGRPVECQ